MLYTIVLYLFAIMYILGITAWVASDTLVQ